MAIIKEQNRFYRIKIYGVGSDSYVTLAEKNDSVIKSYTVEDLLIGIARGKFKLSKIGELADMIIDTVEEGQGFISNIEYKKGNKKIVKKWDEGRKTKLVDLVDDKKEIEFGINIHGTVGNTISYYVNDY